MIKLIASDLDGTLLQNDAQQLNPKVFDLIRALKEEGVLFVAASGRQYYNLQNLFAPVKDDIAYVAENGSLCIYKNQILSKGIIDKELGIRIIKAIQNFHRCDCIVSGETVCYTDSRNPRFIDHMINVMGNNMEIVNDLSTDIKEEFLKIAVCDFDGTKRCEKYLKDLFGSEIKIVTSGNIWVDFIAPGTNKGVALEGLLNHLHIDPKDCVSFGDQYNDVEMLQLTGTSYAMSNAAPGISYYSTYVTDSVEEVLEDIAATLIL